MEGYFNYFTEIEERFQQRRGTALLLSTLDWALIETWKDAGVPLAAVLRGIDAAFDRWERRPSKTRKVNALAYCAQEVLAAAEEMSEAAVGSTRGRPESGLEKERLTAYLTQNAEKFEKAAAGLPAAARATVEEQARTLREQAAAVASASVAPSGYDLELRMTVMEEKLFAVLLGCTPDGELVGIRAEAERELAPYRGKMNPAQIEQLMKQYTNKKLMERYGLPRLSLYYML